MQTKIVTLLAAVVLAATLAPAAAGSDGTVTVTFTADASAADLWGAEPFVAECAVDVPAAADGHAVFAAAIARGCVSAYTYTTYAYGDFVDCIDDVCGETLDPLYLTVSGYWAFSVNGVSASYGVSDYRAQDGDAFAWTYTNSATWAGIVLP